MDVERGVYNTNSQPNRATFKYEQGRQFFLGLAKIEIKYDGTITRKRCPVFDYTGNKFFAVDAYKK